MVRTVLMIERGWPRRQSRKVSEGGIGRVYREVADLIEKFGMEKVEEASLEVLGYPAVMITYPIEHRQINMKLRGISPMTESTADNSKPRKLRVTNKPITPKQSNTKTQRQVAPSLFQ